MLEQPDRIAIDGAATAHVAVLDFNGDQWPDIALVGTRTVELILGRRDGWDPPQTTSVPGSQTWGQGRLAAADLTGDGQDDLVVVIAGGGQVAVLRGRQDGVLTTPSSSDIYNVADPDGSYIPGPGASVDVGDLNGDGSLDVVAAFRPADAGTVGTIVPLVNDGHGALTPAAAVPVADPEQVRLVTLGGDNDPDLVVAQGNGGGIVSPTPPRPGKLLVLPGGTGATFGSPTPVSTGFGKAVSVAAGDVNGDGAQDIAVGLSVQTYEGLSPQLLLGDPGTPALGAPIDVLPRWPDPIGTGVEIGDLDRDGLNDVTIDTGHNPVMIMTFTGASGFALAGTVYIYPAGLAAWTLADADGDAKLDVILVATDTGGSEVRVYYGSGPRSCRRPDGWTSAT